MKGGAPGARPNRAVSVYASLVRRAFPGLPVVAGGIEASLRRVSHYDFWTDSLRKSLLPDARLDLIVYGMGEAAVLDIARRLDAACAANFVDAADILPREEVASALAGIPGTARMIRMGELAAPEGVETEGGAHVEEIVRLPSHEDILARPALLIQATLLLERQVHQMRARAVQPLGGEGDSGKSSRARPCRDAGCSRWAERGTPARPAPCCWKSPPRRFPQRNWIPSMPCRSPEGPILPTRRRFPPWK